MLKVPYLKSNIRLLIQLLGGKFVIVHRSVRIVLNLENVFVVVESKLQEFMTLV
jgi:hypothetical protein